MVNTLQDVIRSCRRDHLCAFLSEAIPSTLTEVPPLNLNKSDSIVLFQLLLGSKVLSKLEISLLRPMRLTFLGKKLH